MFTKFALRSILVLCVIMLLSTLMVGSAVTAKQSALSDAIQGAPPEQSIQGGNPIPGGPGFISVGTFAFTAWDPAMKQTYANSAWMYNGSGTYGYYYAPVNLPHGATVTKVVFFYYDAAPSNMTFYLERVNMFDGSTHVVAQTASTGSAGYGFMESTIYYPAIDNQLYSYRLRADIPHSGANLSLINTRIDYSYPSYLPCIQN